jgi:hypothetical protein
MILVCHVVVMLAFAVLAASCWQHREEVDDVIGFAFIGLCCTVVGDVVLGSVWVVANFWLDHYRD